MLSGIGRGLSARRALVASAALCAAGCARGGAGGGAPPATPVKIETARVVKVDEATEYVATLKSRDSAAIMPQVEGEITQILVRSGQRVTPGTPLVQIDPAKQQATVKSHEDTRAAKQAALDYAKQQYERVSGLQRSGISSQQDLDQARSALDAAAAELQSLDAQVREEHVQLHYYQVSAPMSGIVGDIPVRIGDRVTVSTLLTTVDKPGSLEVYVNVPLERAPRLHPGLRVEILDGNRSVVATSAIGFVSPRVDDATQTVLAKALVPNEEGVLRTSQFVRARIVWETHEGPVIPVVAVTRVGSQTFAFLAVEEKGALVARQRSLKVGEIVGDDYVVLEGIEPGEKVVVSGTQFLADGAPVKPQG
jgi:RND family efflux transporter MFP subunit